MNEIKFGTGGWKAIITDDYAVKMQNAWIIL